MVPGFHSLTLSLDVRDGWLGNNRRFATFQVREPKKILVVSDRPESRYELQDTLRANRFDVETEAGRRRGPICRTSTPSISSVSPGRARLCGSTLAAYVEEASASSPAMTTSRSEGVSRSALMPGQYGKVELCRRSDERRRGRLELSSPRRSSTSDPPAVRGLAKIRKIDLVK